MHPMLDNTFKNRSVFVTGHTGFKGSWLCLWLAKLGARVTGYALEPPTEPSHFKLARVRDTLHHEVLGDVRDTQRLTQTLSAAKPDVVLHMAAQTIVRQGYREPLETFSANVMGTASVLEAIRLLGHPCAVVIVSTDKCYENREQVWGYREDDPMGDRDPYSASKGAAELVVRSYRDSYFPAHKLREHGIRVASARSGNVIGGGDWTPDALIVDLVNALAENRPVELRNPGAVRPWQHVLQALSGYLTLAARLLRDDDPALCSGWNFGPLPGADISVRDLVERFCDAWGSGRWLDVSGREQEHEANVLRLCIDKALWQLDWKPCWSTDEMLAHTASWYRRWLEGKARLQHLAMEQIAAYEQAMRSASGASGARPTLTRSAGDLETRPLAREAPPVA